jgi:hypothetical protein
LSYAPKRQAGNPYYWHGKEIVNEEFRKLAPEKNRFLLGGDWLNPNFAIAKFALRAATPQLVIRRSGVNPAKGGRRQNLQRTFLSCVV